MSEVSSAMLYICGVGTYSSGNASSCLPCLNSLLPGAAFCSPFGGISMCIALCLILMSIFHC